MESTCWSLACSTIPSTKAITTIRRTAVSRRSLLFTVAASSAGSMGSRAGSPSGWVRPNTNAQAASIPRRSMAERGEVPPSPATVAMALTMASASSASASDVQGASDELTRRSYLPVDKRTAPGEAPPTQSPTSPCVNHHLG